MKPVAGSAIPFNGTQGGTTDTITVHRTVANKWYEITDHLGNIVAMVKNRKSGFKTNSGDSLYSYWKPDLGDLTDYYPFGMKMPNRMLLDSNDYGYNGQKSERDMYKSINANLGKYDIHSTAKFWEYDNRIVRRWNIDPVPDPSQSVYSVFSGNPIWNQDVLGNEPSTHTDESGKVLAVYDDGDKGVYKHGNNADGKIPTRFQLDRRHEKSTSAGGKKMGETDFWDEFADLKTKQPAGDIFFSKDPQQSWHPLINWGHERSNGQDLYVTKGESERFQILDIKNNTDWAPAGPMTGRLMNGKYATARSAGNFLAGLNGVTGKFFGKNISGTTYMKLAGAYQVKKMSFINALRVVGAGTSFGPPPYYGEEEYSGRRILQGIQAGEIELKK